MAFDDYFRQIAVGDQVADLIKLIDDLFVHFAHIRFEILDNLPSVGRVFARRVLRANRPDLFFETK